MKLENEARNSVKSWELKKFNRSMLYRVALDPLADKVVAQLPEKATSTMISLGALGCAFLAYLFASSIGPSRLSSLLVLVLLFLYQLLDNLNLKQALKQNGINLQTVYIDHICDSLSCSLIAMSMSHLLGLSVVQGWFVLLGFALVPYYVDHLAMYYSDKLEFEVVNPVDEGLALLQFLCLLGFMLGGDFWDTPTLFDIQLKNLLLLVFTIVLFVYVGLSIKKITENNSNPHDLSLKNLLVSVIVFQVFLEISVLTNILTHPFTTGLLQLSFTFVNSLLVGTQLLMAGRLIVAYGSMEKFNQLSIDFLLLTIGTIVFCSLQFLFQISEDTYSSEIFAWSAFLGSLGYFAFYSFKTNQELASILNSE